MATLLFEIGCEELPASACREAKAQLPALVERFVGVEPSAVFVGPRRIAFLVEDIPGRTPDETIKGPPVELADKAAEGFARRHGLTAGDLVERDGLLWADIPGRSLVEVLPERLAELVRSVSFGKSMDWGASIRFSRPVRWLCAKLDSKTIPVAVEGVPSVGHTYGHRFTSDEVEFHDASAWLGYLRNASVEPDDGERRRLIVAGLDALGDWRDPMGKLEEVIHLVESPAVLSGSFDERFLTLPPRVVEIAMQSHQRYFPLGGSRFAFVANGGDPAVVVSGNERVLEGRLEDATFTFERDIAAGIEGLAARLATITFFAGAGSFADKSARLVALVEALGGADAAREAARLAKADQAAELVREFTDLEGHIGAQYARLAGLPEPVSAAIEEQYLPDSAGGPLPQTEAGRLVAAADKIDTLTVAFGLGQRPTGSRDPYGLRRAAIGVCRLAVEGGVRIPRTLLPDDVRDFVEERLEGLLDVPVEFVRAARASNMVEDVGGVAGLARFLAAQPEGTIGPVREVYIRSARLGADADDAPIAAVLVAEPAEIELWKMLGVFHPGSYPDDLGGALAAAASLAPVVERFFEDVLVMADDPDLRANRLRLLRDVRDAVGALGDLSLLPG